MERLVAMFGTMFLVFSVCSCSKDESKGKDVPADIGSVTDVPVAPDTTVSDLPVQDEQPGPDAANHFDDAGAWAAFLPGGGEFSKYEYRLFLWAVGEKDSGQIQVYAESVAGKFKRQMKLYAVEHTSSSVSFRFAEEEEVRATLTRKEERGKTKLVGTFQYFDGNQKMVDQKDVTFEYVGATKPCTALCPGQFCDLITGTCQDCGNADCEPDCLKTADCKDDLLACHEAKGTCYYKCTKPDECGPNSTCIDGFCGFAGQI